MSPVFPEPSPVSSDPAALATGPLDGLADLPGFEAIRQSWRAALDGQLAQLHDFIASDALAAAGRLSHAIRGSSASLGYPGVAQCAAHLEAAARRGDGCAARAALAQLMALDELHAPPGAALPAG